MGNKYRFVFAARKKNGALGRDDRGFFIRKDSRRERAEQESSHASSIPHATYQEKSLDPATELSRLLLYNSFGAGLLEMDRIEGRVSWDGNKIRHNAKGRAAYDGHRISSGGPSLHAPFEKNFAAPGMNVVLRVSRGKGRGI